ncbi:glycosyltransferase [Synechococcus sp. CCY9201]|uniref:glycosyltransferase n=1 Tax=Synechococcus sp. CCY9201 TaxID=174697 RepID=UPI002B2050BA|nr:glycosyltransferase [Synechococcus sp. CCY9201]MEA5474674.1 glycosyltransferase [Synechococcus sp. CCY9201]
MNILSSSIPPSLSVLLLIGCYESEAYDERRLDWLEMSLNDLRCQTFRPTEIIVSLNSSVSHSDFVTKLVSTYIDTYSCVKYSLPRSGAFNFETLISLATSDLICFWSDHDRHGKLFLEQCVKAVVDYPAMHACPIINYAFEDGRPYTPEPVSLFAVNTCSLSSVDSLKSALSSDIRGSIYGIWKRQLFNNIPSYGIEKIDFLLVYAAALSGGYVFFESDKESLVLRHKKSKGNNHSKLLPSLIMSEDNYRMTAHSRLLRGLVSIIGQSSLGALEKSRAMVVVRKTFSSKSNYCGCSYLGAKLMLKSIISLVRGRQSISSFVIQLGFAMSAWQDLSSTYKFKIN